MLEEREKRQMTPTSAECKGRGQSPYRGWRHCELSAAGSTEYRVLFPGCCTLTLLSPTTQCLDVEGLVPSLCLP